MKVRWLVDFLVASSILSVFGGVGAQELRQLEFQSTDAEFLNPERGFYRYRNLDRPTDFDLVRAEGQTIIYGRVEASDFRDRPLSDEFLASIQAGFDEAREHGLKVKFRLAYNDGFEPDAPKDIILNHISQLQPLWENNADVMFHMDAGFIGAWGEWHASTNGLDNFADRSEILHAILDALPTDRTVGLRYPSFKRRIFSGSQLSDRQVISAESAFDGSDLSRVGHLNDCFLSSENDVGTYTLLGNNWPLERELAYIGSESLYVPFGGETCALDDRSKQDNATAEMTTLHIDYLNLDYHPEVIQRWKDEGTFDEIQRRLGYRFELGSVELPTEVRPGGLIPIKFTVNNAGFGELFNPRNVEVTLEDDNGTLHTAKLAVDPRRWAGGESNDIEALLAIPDTLPTGDFSVGLWLPDAADSLRNDPRYAVRFANEGLWDESTGINLITNDLVVSDSAVGAVYSISEFVEVLDPSSLTLKGDFDLSGTLDPADIDLLSSNLNNGQTEFDLNGDLIINQIDRTVWVESLANTRFGDADLNGTVEFADFLALSEGFGSPGGWSNGNFDGRDGVDFSDFLLLSDNFGAGDAAASQTVPEPTLMILLIPLAGVVLIRRTRTLKISVN